MLNFAKTICTFLVVTALALTTLLITLNGQNQPSQSNQLKRKPKKRISVLRQQGQNDVKPTAEEIRDFGRTPRGQILKRVMTLRSGRKLLRDKGVPFEPNILLDNNWREKLRNTLATLPDFQLVRREGNKLEGAQLADTLILPEKVELTGDTVIVAKRLIFEGRNVVIKGRHDLHVFTDEPTTLVEGISPISQVRFTPTSSSTSINLKQYLSTMRVVLNGHITIDTSGKGRKEWLESQRQRTTQQSVISQTDYKFVKANFSFNKNLLASLLDENTSGQNGADGTQGDFGTSGTNGENGSNGANGNCNTDRNGQDGNYGSNGGDGTTGGNGSPGINGSDANDINFSVPQGSTQSYTFIANGGEGGKGGKGGQGGTGGIGGNGGKGGNGADCPCFQGGGGSGGRGGEAGDAGDGGNGGNGADGGNGGNGGTITVTYSSGYDPQNISATANLGQGGAPGGQGSGGYAGSTGTPGNGGSGAGPFDCPGGNGTGGNVGRVGSGGEFGDETGNIGTNGNAGSTSISCSDCGGSGGGGGDYCSMYPSSCYGGGGGGGGCTPYYWNYYESHDGGQTWYLVDSSYAGCW